MRKNFLISSGVLLIIFFIFLFTNGNGVLPQEVSTAQLEYVPNEVLVRFNEDVNKEAIQAIISSIQGKVITNQKKEISFSEWDPDVISYRSFRLNPFLLHLKVPESIGTEQAIYLLSLSPYVKYAEKNQLVELCDIDPYFGLQWALENTGQAGGTPNADIDATDAWNVFTGSSDIVVAVIDSGTDYNHEDLAGNIWENPGEIYGNGIDDDNNGKIDDYYGWDFYENDQFPLPQGDPDKAGHGTHVAGIIGAIANNPYGIKGVCWNVKIMVLRAFGPDNKKNSVDKMVSAVEYSTEMGAHLSNNSYKLIQGYSETMEEAIRIARDWTEGSGGKLFIAAAGNYRPDHGENPTEIVYPAAYNLENIISVLGTTNKDEWASAYSRYHITKVDLGAPGGSGTPYTDGNDIFSLWHLPYNKYQYKAGTSMAAPHVSGVAALMWGKPYKIWWDQVKEIIMESVDEREDLEDKCVTGGRLNAYEAIYEPIKPNPPINLNAYPTAWTQINLSWQDDSDNELGFIIRRRVEGSLPWEYTTIGIVKENNTTYKDKTATGGLVHDYAVGSYNLSNYAPGMCLTSCTIPATIPAKPTGLWARSPSPPDGVSLRWHDNSNNEEYFIIERKSLSYPFWQEIDGAGPNATTYFDEDVDPGETYWHRVKACNPIGDSYPSNVIEVEIFYF